GGCPVCVTPLELINKAIEIASLSNVTLCVFGDMLRVPGSDEDLQSVKAQGGDVRIIYSPTDALQIARNHRDREVVLFAVGFETTVPAYAAVVYEAFREDIKNFSLLLSQVLVPPALDAILKSPANRVQGFLAPGHVCTVMGYTEYESLAEKYRVPIVVAGFEPLDILQGFYMCIDQLEQGKAYAQNQYARSVVRQGNEVARKMIEEVFCVVGRKWRGMGEIPQSGLGLTEKYSMLDAERRFGEAVALTEEDSECISGTILLGTKKPQECPAFGVRCTPENPLGATMVSGEGACAAYYKFRGIEARS
ncbi:hydrogenase formation protein HupD, partial [Candidatus Nitromaritima sp. SCGC AAA799-C22]